MKLYKMMVLMLVASFILTACPGLDEESSNIIVVNQINKPIGFQANLLNEPLAAEDTLLQKYPPIMGIRTDSLRSLPAGTNSDWRQEMQGHSYLQILIVNIDNYIDNYNKYILAHRDTLRKYVPVLRRYQLTLSDLEQLHWAITYPPTEAMKDVKMWPPYKKQE